MNCDGCDNIGPKPPAALYAHASRARPSRISSGALNSFGTDLAMCKIAGAFRRDELMVRLGFLGQIFQRFFNFFAQVHDVKGLANEIESSEIHSLGG